jgi:hypothetical protein
MDAQVHWLLGYSGKALAIGSGALALAEQLAHSLASRTRVRGAGLQPQNHRKCRFPGR